MFGSFAASLGRFPPPKLDLGSVVVRIRVSNQLTSLSLQGKEIAFLRSSQQNSVDSKWLTTNKEPVASRGKV
jgi:hypothetical protein